MKKSNKQLGGEKSNLSPVHPFSHSTCLLTIEHVLNTIDRAEAWPSGKAGACKALIPSSNLGASFSNPKISWK